METKVSCFKCQYHFITFDKTNPYGCKAFGFKSRKTPSMVVKESSGQQCYHFIKKEQLK